MAKATASPLARRHNGDRLRAKAKPRRHQTKETPPPKHESAWKYENKPGFHSPFSLNQIGTLSLRHLAQFVSAIDTPIGPGGVSCIDSRMRWQRNQEVFLLTPNMRPI